MILVTGASGLLGLAVARLGVAEGRAMAGLSQRHRVAMPGLDWRPADLRDGNALGALVDELRPECIVHAAALTHVDLCERDPEQAFAVNALPCSALAAAANRVGALLAYVSTDAVFDGTRGGYAEDDAPAPLSAYARSKLRGEEIVLAEARRPLVVRTTLYGWNGQPKLSLGEWIVRELTEGRPITGFEDVVFCPLLADDLAATILALAARGATGVYHVGARDACDKLSFARRVAAAFGLPAGGIRPGRLAEAKLAAPRPLDTSLRCAKAERLLGAPFPSVDEGIARFRGLATSGLPGELRGYIVP